RLNLPRLTAWRRRLVHRLPAQAAIVLPSFDQVDKFSRDHLEQIRRPHDQTQSRELLEATWNAGGKTVQPSDRARCEGRLIAAGARKLGCQKTLSLRPCE